MVSDKGDVMPPHIFKVDLKVNTHINQEVLGKSVIHTD